MIIIFLNYVPPLFKVVAQAFHSIWNVVKKILTPVWDAIKEFASWFEDIIGGAKKVLDVFHNVNNVVEDIEDAIKPIKWALDAVKCIFDTIVNPVLNWIMDVSNVCL